MAARTAKAASEGESDMNCHSISAHEALEAFKGRDIMVSVTTPTTRSARDIAGRRVHGPGFNVEQVPLSVEHIMAAKRWDDGRITISTIDGQKHEISSVG